MIILMNTIELIWKTGQVSSTQFEILYAGLQNSWVQVYYHTVGRSINTMLGSIDGIERLIYDGIRDRKWQTRFNPVYAIEFRCERLKCKEIKDIDEEA